MGIADADMRRAELRREIEGLDDRQQSELQAAIARIRQTRASASWVDEV
jgi:hypothetical protein